MLIAYFMNEFDKAYIFISSMTSRQKIDMCACFLKLGYGISEDNTTSIQVVNLSDDNKFSANLSFLFKKFKINCYIRICKEKNRDTCRDRENEKNDVKQKLHLKTYKDYGRLSRQAISAIYDRVFSRICEK